MCVCVRETERHKQRDRDTEREIPAIADALGKNSLHLCVYEFVSACVESRGVSVCVWCAYVWCGVCVCVCVGALYFNHTSQSSSMK